MAKTRKLFNQKARGLMITRLMARDGLDCQLCGESLDRSIRDEKHPRYITADHLYPSSKGGWDDIKNLQLAHLECNQRRGSMPLNDFLEMEVMTESAVGRCL